MELLALLKSRRKVAERFTKDFHEDVKRSLEDYDPKRKTINVADSTERYAHKVAYIYATHRSMHAKLFDRTPELVISDKGRYDEEKKMKIEAAYEYLKDKLRLEDFKDRAAWDFLLHGMVFARVTYRQDTHTVPVYDMTTGEETEDTREELIYDDPVVTLGDPSKDVMSPEAKWDDEGVVVPYYAWSELMEVDKVKRIYDVKVKADEAIDDDDAGKEEGKDDIKRVRVYFYIGSIPEDTDVDKKLSKKLDVSTFDGSDYYCVYTSEKVLHATEADSKMIIGGWEGNPHDFFRFGLGVSLRDVQRELSLRREQQMRYGDYFSYPKLAHEMGADIDEDAAMDPRAGVLLGYKDTPPQYLQPPSMPDILTFAEQKAREDGQYTAGLLDLSSGAQKSSVVDTATGQQIFDEASEKVVRMAKKRFLRFYRDVVIELLKKARDNWDEAKMVKITDEEGNEQEMELTREDLQDVDFDTDVDVQIESASVNKDVVRAQWLRLLNDSVNLPFANSEEIYKHMLRETYDIKDPRDFIKEDPMGTEQMMQGGQPDQGNIPTSESDMQVAIQRQATPTEPI